MVGASALLGWASGCPPQADKITMAPARTAAMWCRVDMGWFLSGKLLGRRVGGCVRVIDGVAGRDPIGQVMPTGGSA
jgi:hypothetical protein